MSGWSNPGKPGTDEPPVIDPWFFEIEKTGPVGISVKSAKDLSPEATLRDIVSEAGPSGIEPRRALAELAARGFVYARTGKRVHSLRRRAGIVTRMGRSARWTVLP